MKLKKIYHSSIAFPAVIFTGMLFSGAAIAQTWNQTGAGPYSWNDNGNWSAAFPNAISASADMRVDLAAAQLVNLNEVITVGTLRLGDTTTDYFGTTIAPNSGSLTFDVDMAEDMSS